MTRTTSPSSGPENSRERILEAAIRVFMREGRAGARIDAIGAEAGVNKQLIYYYFANKDALYVEALKSLAARTGTDVDVTGGSSGEEALRRVLDPRPDWAAAEDMWRRMWIWESLDVTQESATVLAEAERSPVFTKVAEAIEEGACLPDGVTARQLMLAATAISTFPAVFPQLAKLATGRWPWGSGLETDQARLVDALLEALAPWFDRHPSR